MMVISHGGNGRMHKEQWNADVADLSHPLKNADTRHYNSEYLFVLNVIFCLIIIVNKHSFLNYITFIFNNHAERN